MKVKRKTKNILFSILAIFFFTLAVSLYTYGIPFTPQNLRIGVFSQSFWDVQNGNAYLLLDEAIEQFEQESGIRVEYTSGVLKEDYSEWLAEQLVSQTAPDLFFVLPEDFNQLADINAFENLDVYLSKEPQLFQDSFYSSALQSGYWNEQLYALPFECAPKLMFINSSILEKEGLPLPEADWSWDDFFALCQKVTKDTNSDGIIDQYGVIGYDWSDAFQSNGVQLFSDDGMQCFFNTEPVKEALQFIEKLTTLEQPADSKEFDLGNVLFQPMLFSEFRAYKPYPLSVKKYSNFDWNCIPMPSGPSGKNVSSLQCLMVGISSSSRNKDQAWQFLKKLTSPEVQAEIFQYSEGVSVLHQVTEKDQTLAELMRSSPSLTQNILSQAVEQAVVPPRFERYSDLMDQVGLAVNEILENSRNLEMDMIIQNRKINQILQQDDSAA